MKIKTFIITAATIGACCILPACTPQEAKYNDMVGEDQPVELLPTNGVIVNKAKYEYSGDGGIEYIVKVKYDDESTKLFRVTENYFNTVKDGDKFVYDEEYQL